MDTCSKHTQIIKSTSTYMYTYNKNVDIIAMQIIHNLGKNL